MRFDEAFDRLIDHEKGFSADPKDRGNWTGGRVGVGVLRGTKYGISAAAYPHLHIESLTLSEARALYLSDYWNRFHVERLPASIRFDFFDGVVNSGPGNRSKDGAVRWLQRALGVEDDGVIGPKTLAALAEADPVRLAMRFNGVRLDAMTNMATWPDHGRGWARRIAKNLMAAGSPA